MSTPYAVLPLIATRFAACSGGIWVTFIEPYLTYSDIKLFVWDIQPVHLFRWNLLTCFPCFCNLKFSDISFEDLLWFKHRNSLFSCLCMSMSTPNRLAAIYRIMGIWDVFMRHPLGKTYLGFVSFSKRFYWLIFEASLVKLSPPGAVFCGGWPKMVALTGVETALPQGGSDLGGAVYGIVQILAHLVSRVSRPQLCWGLAILCDPPFFSGYIEFGGVVVKFLLCITLYLLADFLLQYVTLFQSRDIVKNLVSL